MNNGDFKHFLPIEKPSENALIRKPNKFNRLNITNIGQILLICFLFVVIFTQTAGLISAPESFSDDSADGFSPAEHIETPTTNPAPESDNTIIPDKNNLKEIYEILFILGENNGKIAVLSPDRETVYETFDVYIDTLPDCDKNLLLDGIEITKTEELYSLLEDYCS